MDGLAPEEAHALLRWLKDGPAGAVPIRKPDRSLGRLQAVTWHDAADRERMALLGRWHERAFACFPDPFAVAPDGAHRWLAGRVLGDPARVLFWVRDACGGPRGHVGLTLDTEAGTATVCDVLSAHPAAVMLTAAAVDCLASWARRELGLRVEFAAQARAA